MNPLAYLLVSLEFTSLMLAAVFLIAWFNFGRRRHALLWSLAFFIAAIQWLINLTIASALPFPAYWLLVSLTSIGSLSLALAGHRMRAGLPVRWGWFLVGAFAVEGSIAWYTLAQPHVGLRMAIGPFYGALTLGLCVPAILRHRGPALPSEWGAAIVTGIFAICEGAAAVAILTGGAKGSEESLAIYRAINFLSMPAAYTGMGMFTLLVLAADISQEMKMLALKDSLTGVLNVRGFGEAANRALVGAKRRGTALSAIVCDIDHFKAINDHHGHAAGDQALRRFAQHLLSCVRPHDVVGRVGGEEFVVLLPNTPLAAAVDVAEHLRASLASWSIDAQPAPFQVQASFGVADLGAPEDKLEALLQRADTALYASKHGGRNRVSVAREAEALGVFA
ncbi:MULTISPECIES: GGDEF domain-containing protein [unclassified Pseudoxanthomonas]|uniref:GGDEF domain-containing protein n=1 Tax=unclassified Pseudoxanthomonas TaxID=2645906 RepID=UPI00307702D8